MSTCASITYGIDLGDTLASANVDTDTLEATIAPYACQFEMYGNEKYPHYIICPQGITVDAPLSKGGVISINPSTLQNTVTPKHDYAIKRACEVLGSIGVTYPRPSWILFVWEEE